MKKEPENQEMLILLVEDYAPIRNSLAFLLEVAGYKVITASDGVEALKVLNNCLPNLIISDIDMPNMDGYDLLRSVRAIARWSAIPFMVISERYTYGDFMFALDLGANEYIPKPFNFGDVVEAIDRFFLQQPAPLKRIA